MISSYKDLTVWKKSMELVVMVYEFTALFPKTELYGLISQMRRCSVSIPSNISEGSRRGSRKDFRQFLLVAYGSGAELETQIEIVRRLPWGKDLNFIKVNALLSEVMKMLNKFIASLQTTN
ncbi:MAG: four helix bundle protein [Patescibacteria group bacterium]